MARIIAAAAIGLCIGMAAPTPARACNSATQIQLYPLGVAQGSLIALLLYKDYDGAEHQTLEVTATLVRVTGNKRPKRLARLGKHKIGRVSLARKLRPVLKKALARAKRLRGFKRLKMTHWTTCEHRRKCGGAKVTMVSKKLGVAMGKKRKMATWPLSGTYRHPRYYRIASVRRFSAGKTKWVVVDLRAGNPRCSSIVHKPSSRSCARAKQTKHKAEGSKVTLRADSSPQHHGWDIAVAVRLK